VRDVPPAQRLGTDPQGKIKRRRLSARRARATPNTFARPGNGDGLGHAFITGSWRFQHVFRIGSRRDRTAVRR
jgi:hypothetical protein